MEEGRRSVCQVRRREVSAAQEFIILRCQSRSLGEQMKGRSWEGASAKEGLWGASFVFVRLLVIIQKLVVAYGVVWHPLCAN